MSSSYEIVPVLQNPNVNRGESIEVFVYITGAGGVDRQRVKVIHHYEELFNEEVGLGRAGFEPMEISDIDDDINVVGQGDSEWAVVPISELDEEEVTQMELGNMTTTVDMPPWLFSGQSESIVHDRSAVSRGSEIDTFDDSLSDSGWGGEPPLKLKFNISDCADPGDYQMSFVFIYESDGEIMTDRSDIEFHVNNIIEEFQPWIKWTVVTVAILSLIATVVL